MFENNNNLFTILHNFVSLLILLHFKLEYLHQWHPSPTAPQQTRRISSQIPESVTCIHPLEPHVLPVSIQLRRLNGSEHARIGRRTNRGRACGQRILNPKRHQASEIKSSESYARRACCQFTYSVYVIGTTRQHGVIAEHQSSFQGFPSNVLQNLDSQTERFAKVDCFPLRRPSYQNAFRCFEIPKFRFRL